MRKGSSVFFAPRVASELCWPTCFSSSSAYFRKWGVYMCQYKWQVSGQLTQQETLTHLAIRVLTRNSLAALRAVACAQMTQNILTQTDRRIFLKSVLQVQCFHKASESSRTISQTVHFNLSLRKIHALRAI